VNVKCREIEAGVVCSVIGNLEYQSVDQFMGALPMVLGQKHVIYDLSGVPFIDWSGAAALVGAVRGTRDRGGDAVICALRPSVKRALKQTGVLSTLSVLDGPDEAESYLLERAAA
jgi:stage II sporulation protein AA (anti-sigma F factor antagonist)